MSSVCGYCGSPDGAGQHLSGCAGVEIPRLQQERDEWRARAEAALEDAASWERLHAKEVRAIALIVGQLKAAEKVIEEARKVIPLWNKWARAAHPMVLALAAYDAARKGER